MRMHDLRHVVVLDLLVGCALLTIGCNTSVKTNRSKSDKNVKTHEAFDIVGTWHSPPRDQKPIEGEWGLTRITMTFTKAGKVESTVMFMDEGVVEDKLKSGGKYSVKGSLLYTEYMGEGGPRTPIRLSHRKKNLVMDMSDEVYVFERIN